MTQIVLINGPKGVGKDTAALAIAKRHGWTLLPVMLQAKLDVLDAFKIDRALLPVYENVKDVSCMDFDGESFREVLISYANQKRAADPKHFVNAWIEAVMRAFAQNAPVVVVPDVRFFEEFVAAVDLVGGKNVYLMRIFRPGHDFTGDVGGYIRTDMAVFGNVECSIQNDQDLEFFKFETTVFAHGFVARARAQDKK